MHSSRKCTIESFCARKTDDILGGAFELSPESPASSSSTPAASSAAAAAKYLSRRSPVTSISSSQTQRLPPGIEPITGHNSPSTGWL